MNKKLVICALFIATCLCAGAEVTPEQYLDAEYIINSGFSEMTAEEILIMKNRASGKPCEPLYEKKEHVKGVNWLKKFYSYLDPGIDSDERYHHDIRPSTHFADL